MCKNVRRCFPSANRTGINFTQTKTFTIKFVENAFQQFWFVNCVQFNMNFLVDPRCVIFFQFCQRCKLQHHARKHILVKVKHSSRKFCVNYDLQVFPEGLFQTIRMWQSELTHLETFTVKFVETAFQYICFVNCESFRRLITYSDIWDSGSGGCGAQYKICARGSLQQGVCDVFVLSQPC